MFRTLYDWVLRLAHHRHADRYLAVVSFAESSVFPIPPDAMLIPMMLARRERAYRIALICTIASVLGACVGYAIGYFLYESVGLWLIRTYGLGPGIARFQANVAEYGVWIILAKGLTPLPFKLVTIGSGFAKFSFLKFIAAAAITRAFRFFLLAWLIHRWGAPMQVFIERYLTWLGLAFLVILLGGFVAFAYL